VRALKKTAAPNADADDDTGVSSLTSAQARRATRHDLLLTRIARTGYYRTPRSALRGAQRQCPQRSAERAARRRALSRARWATWHGWTPHRIAHALGLDSATLAQWRRRWTDADDRLNAHTLGAPALIATPSQRLDVLHFLTLHGTEMSVATVHAHFPHLARRDLACLLHCARAEAASVARGGWYRALTWQRAGAVWAMDHTSPPAPIDGERTKILTVRDLATGCTLSAHAVHTDDADSTIAILLSLFIAHGPPLVLKADNGPAFTSHAMREFLAQHRVLLLLSPPYLPSYNGACEAGNGVIKHLAHDLACRHGRPGHWTLDDLEAARLCANRRITNRTHSQSPEQRFAARSTITDTDRDQLSSAVCTARRARLHLLALAKDTPGRTITADALDRQAIADALLGLGILTIRSCRVRLPDKGF